MIVLTIREKVWVKLKPCLWWNLLATSLALYLLIEPLGFSLTLKTQFHPMDCLLEGRGTKVQYLFLTRASYSSCIAGFHWESTRVCLMVLGSKWASNSLGSNLGWDKPDLTRACMLWELTCLFWTCMGLGGICIKLFIKEVLAMSLDWVNDGEVGGEGKVSFSEANKGETRSKLFNDEEEVGGWGDSILEVEVHFKWEEWTRLFKGV